jgi:hypothetical protein
MRAIMLVIFCTVFLFTNCRSSKRKPIPVFDSSRLSNVSYIKVKQSNQILYISDKIKVDSVLNKIKKAECELIKWASFDYMEFYNSDSTLILAMLFGGNRIKVEGVVYKINSNW